MSKRNEVTRGMAFAVMDKPGVEIHHILLTFRIQEDSETGSYTGFCDELDVSSFGDTVDEAIHNVLEATLLYLNSIEELGERRRVFDERKIEVHRGDVGARSLSRGGTQPDDDSRSVTVQPNELVTTRLVTVPAEV